MAFSLRLSLFLLAHEEKTPSLGGKTNGATLSFSTVSIVKYCKKCVPHKRRTPPLISLQTEQLALSIGQTRARTLDLELSRAAVPFPPRQHLAVPPRFIWRATPPCSSPTRGKFMKQIQENVNIHLCFFIASHFESNYPTNQTLSPPQKQTVTSLLRLRSSTNHVHFKAKEPYISF